jgi:hypothetical protein
MPSTLGSKQWSEQSVFDDDYVSEEDAELSPLDDDYIPEEYRDEDD